MNEVEIITKAIQDWSNNCEFIEVAQASSLAEFIEKRLVERNLTNTGR